MKKRKKRQYLHLRYRASAYYRSSRELIWEGDYKSLDRAWRGLKRVLDSEPIYTRGRIDITWKEKKNAKVHMSAS